jgi:WD40 repeat protein
VRIWDPSTHSPIGEPLTGHTGAVSALACTQLEGIPIAVTGSRDATLRIWDLAERRQVDEFEQPTDVGAVAVSSLGEVVLGLNWDVAVLERMPQGWP